MCSIVHDGLKFHTRYKLLIYLKCCMDDSMESCEKDVSNMEESADISESVVTPIVTSTKTFDCDSSELNENLTIDESQDFSTSISIQESLKNLPEVLTFIKRLQDYISRQQTLIHRLYEKLKEASAIKKPTKDSFTQTSETDMIWLEPAETGNLVEDIKKAAENAVQQTGFVYETTSGMYYDYNTGYYYNAELGLYYDGNSGAYYYFDESSKSFQIHSLPVVSSMPYSQVNSSTVPKESPNKRKQDISECTKKIPKKIKVALKEEGECSGSSSESESDEVCNITDPLPTTSDSNVCLIDSEKSKAKSDIGHSPPSDTEIAAAWPPCLRVVVKETGLENLQVGSLFIVTCTGGTLGREGDHAIIIPDINISKHHAKISYSEEDKCYHIVDLGSRNGTFINGSRISVALRESDPINLQHGTLMRVGSTHLECHLHLGRETCPDCEPGCAISRQTAVSEQSELDHETKEAKHRSELRRLRKRFGLDKLTVKEKEPSLAPGYQDRAEERRKTVGSQDHNAKTEVASVHQSIQSSNKGFKMLSKMGWSKGQSLGKDSTKGITEPVLVEQRPEKAGLGSDVLRLPSADPKVKKKTELWKKAQKRFQELDD